MSAPAIQPLAPPDDPVDRRERRPVNLRGHAILSDLTLVEVIILDLSYDGCGIQVPNALKPGDSIRLSVLQRGVIDTEVRWYAKGKAGLTFTPEADGADEERHRERQSQRVPLLADVSLRRLGKIKYSVRAFDASPHGCRVEFVERPAIDELVRIKFEGLQPLDARICWIEGHCAGLEFERPIHPAVFDLLLARMQPEAERA